MLLLIKYYNCNDSTISFFKIEEQIEQISRNFFKNSTVRVSQHNRQLRFNKSTTLNVVIPIIPEVIQILSTKGEIKVISKSVKKSHIRAILITVIIIKRIFLARNFFLTFTLFKLVLLLFTPILLNPYHLNPIYSTLYHLTLSFHPSIISSRQIAVDIKGMFCHN